jgi:hypothetical protein
MADRLTQSAYLVKLDAAVKAALALLSTSANMGTDDAVGAAARMHGVSFREVRLMVQSAIQE